MEYPVLERYRSQITPQLPGGSQPLEILDFGEVLATGELDALLKLKNGGRTCRDARYIEERGLDTGENRFFAVVSYAPPDGRGIRFELVRLSKQPDDPAD